MIMVAAEKSWKQFGVVQVAESRTSERNNKFLSSAADNSNHGVRSDWSI